MISRIQRALHAELSVPAVFEPPTIRDMAVLIVRMQSGLLDVSETDALLEELESMSDDQLRGLVASPEGNAEK